LHSGTTEDFAKGNKSVMGRLGPLNSLAFGRSPFQAPELDDNGDFILGPHAHDLDNKDFYVQQFDERGHPKNDASKATIRAMQHAQNAVLETVGVVVRREEASKSAWQRQSKKRKLQDILDENSQGFVLREIGPFMLQLSMWWAISLRRRIQTFRCYLRPPLLHVIQSETKIMGLVSFLTDGLLPAITSSLLNNLLVRFHNLLIGLPPSGTVYSWKPLQSFTAGFVIPVMVFPAKAFSVLQSLHLIPSTFHLGLKSFVPFTNASPIQLPHFPETWSVESGLIFAMQICCNAFILSTISDLMRSSIHKAVYRVILLTLASRPDHPDRLTIMAAERNHSDGDTLSLRGIGPANDAERLSRKRTSDFWTELSREMRSMITRIKYWRNFLGMLKFSQEYLKPSMNGTPPTNPDDPRVRARSEALQRQMVRENPGDLRTNIAERLRVQREAHSWALAEFGMSATPGSGDDEAILLPAYEIFSGPPTTIPESVEITGEAATGTEDLQEPPLLFDRFTSDNIHDREEREGEGRMLASLGFNDTNNPVEAQNPPVTIVDAPPELLQTPVQNPSDPAREAVIHAAAPVVHEEGSFDPPLEFTDGLQTRERSPSTFNNIPDDTLSPPPQAPDSPLDRNATPPAVSRNRVRSPTTSHRSVALSSTSGTTRYSIRSISVDPERRRVRRRYSMSQRRPSQPPREAYDSLSSDDGGVHDLRPVPRHRVTMLSVFPAEMFSECLAGFITDIVMLPLDTLYVRSLVHGFLDRPSARLGASAAALGLRRDAYGMNDWLGGSDMQWSGRVRYAGLMALMFGVQGCVSTLSWALATKLAIVFGKQLGWGQL
jgi:hypothetical protein